MDDNRKSQETRNSPPSKFVTKGTFRDVINTAGNVTMGDHVEHNTIMGGNYCSSCRVFLSFTGYPDTHRSSLYPDFVVPDAGYEGSGSRFGCLEGTREAVIGEIFNWKDDIAASPIRLLSGPAGFGKSAIAQTVAESWAGDGTLIASFFFLRGAGGRSQFAHFITTISFQITVSIPETKPMIEKALRDDPTIPHQSITKQLQKLVLGPLASVAAAHSPTGPLIIVVDALDECNDKQDMQDFIGILTHAASARKLPLRWLLTSRREEHINRAFSDDTARATATWVALEDFDATTDIETLLKHHFYVIRKQNPRLMRGIALPWPSTEDRRALVRKSAGMLIFAATLVNFITDGKAPPNQKLRSVLHLHAGLDPLYAQVLGDVPDIACFRSVLTTLILLREQPSVNTLAELLRFNVEDVLHALNFIQSIIRVPADDVTAVQLNHTSLRDFLVDGSRSHGRFINPPPAAHFTIAADCLKLMNRTFQRDVFLDNAGLLYALKYWVEHLQDSAVASEVFPELLRTLDDFVSSEIQNTQRLLAALIEKFQRDAGHIEVNIRVPLGEDHQKGAEIVSRQTSHLAFSFAIERDALSESPGRPELSHPPLGITKLHDLRGALYPQTDPSSSCTRRTCPATLALDPHTPISAVAHKANLEVEGPPAVFIPSQRVGASLLPMSQDHIRLPTRVRRPELYAAEKPLYRGKKEHMEIAAIKAIIKVQHSSSISKQAPTWGRASLSWMSPRTLERREPGAGGDWREADGHEAAGHEGVLRRGRAGWDRLQGKARIVPIVFFCTLKAAYGLLIVLWLLAVLLPRINNMICLEKRTRGLNNGMYWRGGATGAKGRVCGVRGAG
ncbi:hypothetical protein FIBSPDRAFT_964009 [Athelia psychrophila]|uniref:NACHT domain-containing protein n=1 Tax=Athelia psychrophila TaxID=1759441 RepID=A0A165YBE6_9AGAM|nr:hypothetical protein FIBSPDRAFT_964009 [Fibularhizoctonia sp. CBS 109695]